MNPALQIDDKILGVVTGRSQITVIFKKGTRVISPLGYSSANTTDD